MNCLLDPGTEDRRVALAFTGFLRREAAVSWAATAREVKKPCEFNNSGKAAVRHSCLRVEVKNRRNGAILIFENAISTQ